MDDTRRAEKQAHERATRTGNPAHRREYVRLAGVAQKAQDAWEKATRRDTGWRMLNTAHGPRFHREIGASVQLDVEPQIATWLATVTVNRAVGPVKIGYRTHIEAARAIEEAAGVCERDLPLMEGGAL
jgi:hypothetical protein